MKWVTLTRDMKPWRENDRVPVPDELADSLVAEGAGKNLGSFPDDGPIEDKPTVTEKVREVLHLPPKGKLKIKGRVPA